LDLQILLAMITKAKKEYNNLNSTSKYVGWGAIALLLGGIFVYYKGKSSNDMEHVALPSEKGELTGDEKIKIRDYTLKLHDDLTSYGLRNYRLYQDLLIESDRLLVAVYNDFNDMYSKEDSGTLRKWMNDEISKAFPMVQLIDKMNRLNLQ